ncbi:MAG TPA: class I adenylate-forming enzyme family protein [Stellaceae bacterium]|nr:class I adenylate-forming enzyme family protein [Stellaceae bacterium]
MDVHRQNLSDSIFAVAETRPDAPALIENNVTLGYGALARLIAGATVYLRDLGIREGDRVGVALTNSIEHLILMLALARMGAVLVELAAESDARALGGVVAKYKLRAIFTEPNVELPTAVAYPMRLTWRDEIAGKSGDQRSTTDPDKLEIILLTSGSTGEPSGWVLSHSDVLGRCAHYNTGRYPAVADREKPRNLLVILPLRYVWMITSILAQFTVGGPVVLLPEYAKGPDMLRAAASWDDAILAITPNTCRFFLSAAPPAGFLLPRLRLETAGQLLHAEEKRAIATRVTPDFCDCYGTTAGGFLTQLDPVDMVLRPDTVGRAVPGIEIEIVGPGGETLTPGMSGAIRCRPLFTRGPCAEDEGRGSERIEGGWCYTGDVGFLDADGYLHLRGRAGEIMRRGGAEVFAAEIEGVLMAHPQVTEAAVVGRPVAGIGEEIIAFVVRRGGLDHDELARHCRARLGAEKMPSRVFYADGLPRLPGGKVDRLRLQALALEKSTAS